MTPPFPFNNNCRSPYSRRISFNYSISFTKHKYISFLLTTLLLSLILGTGTVFGILIEGKALHLQGLIMGSAIGSLGYVTIHEMLWKAKKQLSFLTFLMWATSGFTNNSVHFIRWASLKLLK